MNDRERVLDAVEIADVVGEQCALKPKGREFVCLCPFHDDRNPSMYVVPHKQMFHCFVCGTGGNAIDFVMKYHGMGFREALEFLAERSGVELTKGAWRGSTGGGGDGGGDGGGVSREALLAANGFALRFYRSILAHGEHGARARALVESRGMSAEMVEAFAVGAAPDRFDGLVKMAASKGESLAAFEAAGLVKRSERGGYYDALRNRVIFPILDQAGRAVAFGGRVIDPEDSPKYLNSPETKVFQKGSQLYGVRQAWGAMRSSGVAVVTEGYTDVIACHQAGFQNVVATLGTALTDRHAKLLRRAVDRVVLLFDGDEAGQRAAERAFEVFFGEPVDVSIAVLPGGRDPADVLGEEGGAERFREAIAGGVDAMEFRFGRLSARVSASGFGVGSQARARVVEEDLSRLVELGLFGLSPIRRQSVVRRYAAVAGVSESAVAEAARALRAAGQRRSAARARRVPEGEPGGVEVGAADGGAGGGFDAGDGGRSFGLPQTAADHALAVLLAWGGEGMGSVRQLAESAGDGEEKSDHLKDFVDGVRSLVSCDAYSSHAAARLASRVGAWVLVGLGVDGAGVGGSGLVGGDGSASSAGEFGASTDVPTVGDDLMRRIDEEIEDEAERGLARSYAIAARRVSGDDATGLASQWRACVRELRRAELSRGGRGQAGAEGGSGGSGLAAALEAKRAAHGAMGGNPRAMPRPRD